METSLTVRADDAVALSIPTVVNIPESVEEALPMFEHFHQAGWGTAAYVYAFTNPGVNQWEVPRENSLPIAAFARLGIRGLTDPKTVRQYRHRWEQAIDDGEAAVVGPGQQDVHLPTSEFRLPHGSAKAAGDGEGDEWYTPSWIFDQLAITFSIDVCSPPDRTHVSVPAETYYTETDDGLAQPWYGLVWCNPPYSSAAPWAERMLQHNNGLLLTHIPMNAAWCMDVWNHCTGIRLFQGIEFVRPDGAKQRPAYWLQIAAFGDEALAALERLDANPDDGNPRRQPSPLWTTQ